MKTVITCLFFFLIQLALSEEWYQRNNPNFISPDEIGGAIKQPNTIKIIKFFTPWCKYCRIIKGYIDQYKQQYQIDPGLKIYDFNCDQSGPGFCPRNYRVSSYPAIIIYDQNGQILYRFGGLYPQNVIWDTLKIYSNMAHELRQNLQKQKSEDQQQNIQNQQKQKQKQNQNLQKETSHQPTQKEQQKVQPPKAEEQKQEVPKPESTMPKPEQNPKQGKQQMETPKQKILISNDNKQEGGIKSWMKLFGYLCCFVVGGFYFKKIMVPQDEDIVELEHGPSQSYEIEPKIEQTFERNNQVKDESQKLVEDVADEDL